MIAAGEYHICRTGQGLRGQLDRLCLREPAEYASGGFQLCVAETTDPLVSRITIVTKANALGIEQINKQLNKLINVIKVHELTGTAYVEREMALIKVKAKPDNRAEILRIVDIFRCKVVDVGLEHFIIEVTGDEGKLTALLNLLKAMGIKKIARTGAIALMREPK